jgi:hypothetical protein
MSNEQQNPSPPSTKRFIDTHRSSVDGRAYAASTFSRPIADIGKVRLTSSANILTWQVL